MSSIATTVIGAVTGAVTGVGVTIMATRQAMIRARRLADTDPLTGLPNRRAANRILDTATSGRRHLWLGLLDLDGFAAINNRYGHEAGDNVLSVIAGRLTQAAEQAGLDPTVSVFRLGGDEFMIVLPAAEQEPRRFSQDLQHTITEPVILPIPARQGPRPVAAVLHPTASIGWADSQGGDGRLALSCADVALHAAKTTGGDTATIYDPSRHEPVTEPVFRPGARRRDHRHLAPTAFTRRGNGGPDPVVWDLYRRITAIEHADGSWPGADVVDVLSRWFTHHGIDIP